MTLHEIYFFNLIVLRGRVILIKNLLIVATKQLLLIDYTLMCIDVDSCC